MKTTLTKRQKQALMALAYDTQGYLLHPRFSGAQTVWGASHSRSKPLAPWTVTFRTLRSVRAAGLVSIADCGGGTERLTLNSHGWDIVHRLNERNDKALNCGSDQESPNVARWRDGLMRPASGVPPIAYSLRQAAKATA